MITVSEADRIISKNVKDFPTVEKPLEKALGALLREDIKADRDIPSFHKALMDGVAISFSSHEKGRRQFTIRGIQSAGHETIRRTDRADDCIEIMTGAVVPQGCDCVVPIEDVRIRNGEAFIKEKAFVKPLQNIRLKAADYKKGQILLEKGARLLAPQIGICASVGKSFVKVSSYPKIAIISTGDELVDIHVKGIKPFQVRQSNACALKAAFRANFLEAKMFHIKDDKNILYQKIESILKKFDWLVISGGVSMGKFDYVPQVLKNLGVKVLFHKVAQKPGKPFWFGKTKSEKLVFALPGNPVSTLICAYRYVIPVLQKALGKKTNEQSVILNQDFEVHTDLTFFLPVKRVQNKTGQLWVNPIAFSGSGDFVALGGADGFVELPAGRKLFKKGFIAKFFRW